VRCENRYVVNLSLYSKAQRVSNLPKAGKGIFSGKKRWRSVSLLRIVFRSRTGADLEMPLLALGSGVRVVAPAMDETLPSFR
jgi:hypothetical protein